MKDVDQVEMGRLQANERLLDIMLRVIAGGLQHDAQKVRAYAEMLADRYDEAGDAKSASRVRRYLAEPGNVVRPTSSGASVKAQNSDADKRETVEQPRRGIRLGGVGNGRLDTCHHGYVGACAICEASKRLHPGAR